MTRGSWIIATESQAESQRIFEAELEEEARQKPLLALQALAKLTTDPLNGTARARREIRALLRGLQSSNPPVGTVYARRRPAGRPGRTARRRSSRRRSPPGRPSGEDPPEDDDVGDAGRVALHLLVSGLLERRRHGDTELARQAIAALRRLRLRDEVAERAGRRG